MATKKIVKSNKLSTAAFIKEQIKQKVDDKKILAAARKRAPKQKIGDHYVSWYRNQMKNEKRARA